ncbi:YhcN/YlaJ family sporulation lipoprotein [Sutcliffiella deserti]|uniref:YhcN/YlaJ family sporulation lipoprotein n=1 Tax=Sutcliffiella deserti TaxID=2875501 RepID=UPI001CBE75C0|nr:YhcN/YlaJ family sporulation lipoprotein [Sutcliffiella deserti]
MSIKGILVTGLALTMLTTGCANVNDYGTEERGAPNDALNVNYDQNNRNLTRNVRNNNNANDESRLVVADRAADKVTELEEIESCNVIVTNRNAYVAAVLDNDEVGGNDLSKQVERKIAEQVRKADGDIRNVYVSVNPEFVDRMGGYANDLESGRPIGGLFDEFTETIQRVFPTNANR